MSTHESSSSTSKGVFSALEYHSKKTSVASAMSANAAFHEFGQDRETWMIGIETLFFSELGWKVFFFGGT